MRHAIGGGFEALAWAATFYARHASLLALAAVAAATRVAYILIGAERLGHAGVTATEAVAGIARLALVVIAIRLAFLHAGLDEDDLPSVAAQSWSYLRSAWPTVLIGLGVVGIVTGAANGALWWAARQVGGDAADRPGLQAVVFAVKNLAVIPLFVLASMRILHWLPHRA